MEYEKYINMGFEISESFISIIKNDISACQSITDKNMRDILVDRAVWEFVYQVTLGKSAKFAESLAKSELQRYLFQVRAHIYKDENETI